MTPNSQGDYVIYENAAIGLEAIRSVLESEGYSEEARVLRGIEIHGPHEALNALSVLRSVAERVRDENVEEAIYVVARALYQAANTSVSALRAA